MLGLGRLRRYLHDRRMKQIHESHRMQHAEDYKRIDMILEEFRTSGGLKHDYQAYKLFSLWRILLVERPRCILELGSGTSTAIFADYVRLLGGQLCSIDENMNWLENSRKLAAIDIDDPRFNLRYAEKRVVWKDGQPVEFGYNIEIEDGGFDLVLIDGPSMRIDGKRYKQGINPEIFELIEHARPRLILVDIRAATVDAMSRRLSDFYSYQLSDIICGELKADYRYFSEFCIRP